MDIGRSLCPTLELNLLPKTLKHLHLACEDVFMVLQQQNINMHDTLPLLESLYLSGRRLREENLKNLPSNLIDLHVDSLDEKIKSSCIFADLPRRIARLTLNFSIVDESELENDLPSELISLTINCLNCHFNWVSNLPKSLKILDISLLGSNPDWQSLPPQLEVVNLRGDPFRKSSLVQLPQSLKSLEVFFLVGVTAEELGPLLPKNLTRFKMNFGKFNHSVLQQLPASLTDFNVIVSATHSDIISFYSPQNIRMRIASGPFSHKLNTFPFPTKLQHLELDHINDDICTMLPPGLQVLRIDGGRITTKGASKLPTSLTSFNAYFEMFDDNQSMSYLRHIPNIELKCQQEFVKCNVDQNWISSLLPSSSSPSSSIDDSGCTNMDDINTHLTSLSVFVVGGYGHANIRPFIQKPFFAALPKFPNLTKLSISDFGNLSSDWLSLIPQKVTDLKIGYLVTYPTATQLSMLPKCLRYLTIDVKSLDGRNCDWNDETLQSLPRTLQTLRIYGPFPNLTERHHEYLPPCLQESELLFVTPLDHLYGPK